MANMVRGFRRIGWVATLPLATFVIVFCFEGTKQFSVTNYEFSIAPDYDAIAKMFGGESGIEIPTFGHAHFSKAVPANIAAEVVSNFSQNLRQKGSTDEFA